MIQKKRHAIARRCRFLWGMVTAVGIASVLWCQSFVSLADSTGTVKVDSVKIREKSDTTSEVIGSAARGTTVTIRDEVQDASGALWYQVIVNANTTGYIRADMVEKKDGGNTQATANDNGQDGSQSDSQPASGATVQAGSAMDAQYATVSVEAIKVRMAPSTNDGVVDRLVRNDQVVVSGQSDGTDGKVWYYVTFTGTNGAERTGFIRSDLLTLGDMVPVPEEEEPEQPVETPAPAEPVNDDYKVTYDQEKDGSYAWYLHDNVAGYKWKVQSLLDTVQANEEDTSDDAKTLVRQRIVIVVLIGLSVLLIAVVIIMALKLRDVYYEEYEDEDEEEDEEEPVSQRSRRAGDEETSSTRSRRSDEESSSQRRRGADEEKAASRRRRDADEEETTSQRRRRTEVEEIPVKRRRGMEEAETESERTARRRSVREDDDNRTESTSANASSKRRAKNFLLDDDEFEFEFLSMDDRDL